MSGRSSKDSQPAAWPTSDDDGDESTGFLASAKGSHSDSSRSPLIVSKRTLILATAANLLLFLASASIFGAWLYDQHYRLNVRLRQASTYSPVHDHLDLGMTPKFLNGTLFPSKSAPSIARQLPNEPADLIWEEYEITRVIPVTRVDIVRMGKNPSTVARLDDDIWGLGDDAYAATFDVFHQLHCLNALRRVVYGTYYNETQLAADTMSWGQIHINHCIDMVMQTLQCSGNVNLVTMHWVETQDYPFPDMSINKQCIDFDRLTKWRKDNTVDMDKYIEVMKKKPEGAMQLPMADTYYDMYEKQNPNHRGDTNLGQDFNI